MSSGLNRQKPKNDIVSLEFCVGLSMLPMLRTCLIAPARKCQCRNKQMAQVRHTRLLVALAASKHSEAKEFERWTWGGFRSGVGRWSRKGPVSALEMRLLRIFGRCKGLGAQRHPSHFARIPGAPQRAMFYALKSQSGRGSSCRHHLRPNIQ